MAATSGLHNKGHVWNGKSPDQTTRFDGSLPCSYADWSVFLSTLKYWKEEGILVQLQMSRPSSIAQCLEKPFLRQLETAYAHHMVIEPA